MNDPKLRAAKDLEETVNTYADTLYRVCLAMLRDPFEAEDTVQELFLAYYRSDKLFESEEHKRAWLVRCAVNRCKNVISFRRRHGQISLDELQECTGVSLDTENRDILDAAYRDYPEISMGALGMSWRRGIQGERNSRDPRS